MMGINLLDSAALPDGWRTVMLGEICRIRRGASPRPAGDPRYFGGTIPWFKIGDATATGARHLSDTEETVNDLGASKSVRIPVGSLIVANSGVSLGFAVITGAEGCIHDGWLYLSSFNGVERDYLYYYFNYLTGALREFASGTTQPNLNTDIARSLVIHLPPLGEQRAAMQILNSLEEKIELNRRMNRSLEGLAEALFKSWFVDFDPVVSKASGRKPYGLDDATAKLFPDGFVEFAKGPIPRDWSIASLTEIADIRGGGTPKTSESAYWNGHHPWFSVVDAPAPHDVFVVQTAKSITDRGLTESAAELLPIGTTIITARGTVGKLAVTAAPMAMNQSCYGLAPTHPFGSCLVYFWAKELVEELQQIAHGSVFDTITRATLAHVNVVIPSEEITKRFEAVVSRWLGQIRINVMQNFILAKTRDSLMPKLLSGEICLANAERQVASVL
jgi:type I restriction enzyme, S subunit